MRVMYNKCAYKNEIKENLRINIIARHIYENDTAATTTTAEREREYIINTYVIINLFARASSSR